MRDMFDLGDDGEWMKIAREESSKKVAASAQPKGRMTRLTRIGLLVLFFGGFAVALIFLPVAWLAYGSEYSADDLARPFGWYFSLGTAAKISVGLLVAGFVISLITLIYSDASNAGGVFALLVIIPHVLWGVGWVLVSCLKWMWRHSIF